MACALLLLSMGCGGLSSVDGDILDRDTFVAVYVDLRLAALDNLGQEIRPAERDSVLAVHGVTPEDLVAFVDAHGRDVPYMVDLWSEVEVLITEVLNPAAAGDDPGGGAP